MRIGKEEAVDIPFLSLEDEERGERFGVAGANMGRMYDAFATEGREISTFGDALKNHLLLERIAKTAGLEMS